MWKRHEPGGGVHQGLGVVVGVRMEDGESREHERGCDQEHVGAFGWGAARGVPRPVGRAGLGVAHCPVPFQRVVGLRAAQRRRRRRRAARTRGAAASMPPVWSGPGDLPDRLGVAGGREVLRLPGALATDAGVGVDQQDRAWSDAADAVDDRGWGQVVGEDRRGGRHHGLRGVDQNSLRSRRRRSRRRVRRRLPRRRRGWCRTRRRRGAASPRRWRSRWRRSGRRRRRDVAGGRRRPASRSSIAGPAHGVAVASALAARVEQQHSVPVRDEHACLVRATGAREEQDRRPVPGGDVGGGQLEPVVGGDGDGLVGHAEVGFGRLRVRCGCRCTRRRPGRRRTIRSPRRAPGRRRPITERRR